MAVEEEERKGGSKGESLREKGKWWGDFRSTDQEGEDLLKKKFV